MARKYGAILTAIWRDRDFKALTSPAQRVYLLAITQPDVSWCGVVPYTSRRWASYAGDTTAKAITKAVDELVSAGFVLVDDDTEELWIRGFVKHNVEDQPKLRSAAKREAAEVHSDEIREAVVKAYAWLRPDQPEDVGKGSSETVDSGVSDVGVGVQCSTPTPTEITPTPTRKPPDAFVEGCHLAAIDQCRSWIERGSDIKNRIGWIDARAKNLQRERADLLDRIHPNEDVSAEEWRSLIQTGRLSTENAQRWPLGCDECDAGWVYPPGVDDAVVPCKRCHDQTKASA